MGWLATPIVIFLLLLIVLAVAIAYALKESRKVIAKEVEPEFVEPEFSEEETWPPSPYVPMLEEEEEAPETPYLMMILITWCMVIGSTILLSLEYSTLNTLLQWESLVFGVFLISRNDKAAKVNGSIVVLIFILRFLTSS